MPLGEEIAGPNGFLGIIFEAGIHKGLFPLIIFMGVGAMTDFGPLIANPKTALIRRCCSIWYIWSIAYGLLPVWFYNA